MNGIKRILGVVWMLLGPTLVYFMLSQAIEKIGKAAEAAKINITLQWSLILTIFIPICIGMVIFGWYALQNEYEQLPESSGEIKD